MRFGIKVFPYKITRTFQISQNIVGNHEIDISVFPLRTKLFTTGPLISNIQDNIPVFFL